MTKPLMSKDEFIHHEINKCVGITTKEQFLKRFTVKRCCDYRGETYSCPGWQAIPKE